MCCSEFEDKDNDGDGGGYDGYGAPSSSYDAPSSSYGEKRRRKRRRKQRSAHYERLKLVLAKKTLPQSYATESDEVY